MKANTLAIELFFFLSTAVFAQTTTIGKSLEFPQLAAGGSWESLVNLSNRGTTTYLGSLHLSNMSPDGKPQPWSPTVNGNPVMNGQMNISIDPGETVTLTITGAGATQAGFGTINPVAPSDSDETSLVEGTLTYYVMSGEKIIDSIGILPSDQIYLTAIPFDKFSTIAFALANTNSTNASVHLTVFSDSNQVVAAQILPLQPNGYTAQYLWQMFPGVQLTSGRLEVQSDTPIIGTALTDVDGQFSSLPFAPAVKSYTWTLDLFPVSGAAITETGVSSVRVNGPLMEFQATQLTKNGQPVQKHSSFSSGTLVNGTLVISIFDEANNNVQDYVISPFTFSMKTATGSGPIFSINPATYLGSGQITLTATD